MEQLLGSEQAWICVNEHVQITSSNAHIHWSFVLHKRKTVTTMLLQELQNFNN